VTAIAKNYPTIKPGEYLKSDYIYLIEKTHSPYFALISFGEPVLLMAYKGEYDLVLIHYFHEFHDGLNIMEDGKAHRVADKSSSASSVAITVYGDNLILTGYNSNGPLRYIYVGDARNFVARKVIVGDYVDADGKTYSFREDGSAYFRDVQFPDEIGLDFVMRPKSWKSKRDYFQNRKFCELFEYEIKDGVISIYRTSGGRIYGCRT